MKQRKLVPTYPDYIKTVRRRGKVYEYFDTGRKFNGKRVYKAMPPKSDPGYGGTYASLLAARTKRENLVEAPTIADVSRAYQKDPLYMGRSESTQSTYLIYLRRIEDEMGEAPVDDIERGDIRTMLDKMKATPGAGNMVLLVMGNLMRYAQERDWIKSNPCEGITPFARGDDEHEPWPEPLIEAAIADPLVGLATALLYYTGQRIGDVCKMRWSDVRDGFVYVKQQKTGKELDIRLHGTLAAMLERTPKEAMTIIHGPKLRPMRPPTLRAQIQKFADLYGCKVVPHGLRKNAVNALLEAECSTAEVSSITGQSLAMVEHYAKRRNNRRMGSAAILKWEGTKSGHGNLGETG